MTERAFPCETAAALAEAVRPWLDHHGDEPPPADAIVAALRTAEAEHGGRERDLWGHAASNAACALTAVDHLTTRLLLSTALGYTRLAVNLMASR
ncbi:hypothetical protein [Streptomyces rochei]|uniref:hypothetical protein n=1 Tax=Streptomyces rochei TaxID=1928 RepID=UPI0033BD3766